MLGVTWRGVLAGGAAVAAAVGLAACGSMSSDSGFANGNPGSSSGGNGDDGGGGHFGDDGGETGSDAGTVRRPSALFVHASPSGANLGPLRLCWMTSTGGMTTGKPYPEQIMPASNFAGLSVGGATLLDDATSMMGGDLTIYAIDAKQLAVIEQSAGAQTCSQLICPQGCPLEANKQYWTLATVSAGTLADGATNVLAIEGCLYSALDPNASTARCGANWSGTSGNLHVDVLKLADSKGTTAGNVSVQAAQLSPGLASLLGTGGSATLSLVTADAGSDIADLGAEGHVLPSSPAAFQLPALADYGNVGIRIDSTAVDAGAGDLFMSLAQAQQLVNPSVNPVTFYGAGGTYLVAVVGDPNAPHAFSTGTSGTYDGTGLHVLVVPAQPAP